MPEHHDVRGDVGAHVDSWIIYGNPPSLSLHAAAENLFFFSFSTLNLARLVFYIGIPVWDMFNMCRSNKISYSYR